MALRTFKTILLAGFTSASLVCHGHLPFETQQGTFKRADAIQLEVTKRFEDGILGPDATSVIFRLPDNSVMTNTAFTLNDVVLRHRVGSLEIWEFASNWLPITSQVRSFDGYKFSRQTGGYLIWISPLIHVYGHPIEYAISLGLALAFCTGLACFRHIQTRGGKIIVGALVTLLGSLAVLAMLVTAASPVVLGMPIAVAAFMWRRPIFGGKRSPMETSLESS